MNEMTRRDIWNDYVATIMFTVGKMICGYGGNEYPMPSWYDLTHSDDNNDDNRTGTDIVNDMITRLRGEEQDAEPV